MLLLHAQDVLQHAPGGGVGRAQPADDLLIGGDDPLEIGAIGIGDRAAADVFSGVAAQRLDIGKGFAHVANLPAACTVVRPPRRPQMNVARVPARLVSAIGVVSRQGPQPPIGPTAGPQHEVMETTQQRLRIPR